MTDGDAQKVTVTQVGDRRYVAVRGTVPPDGSTLAQLLEQATEGAVELILDLGELRTGADADAGVVLDAIRSARRSGAAVAVACDHRATLERLAASGFNQVVPIAIDRSGAQRLVERMRRNQA